MYSCMVTVVRHIVHSDLIMICDFNPHVELAKLFLRTREVAIVLSV